MFRGGSPGLVVITFRRSWVRIPVPYTGWTWHFSHWFVVKNCIVCLKRPKINEKEAGIGPFFLKKTWGQLYSDPSPNEIVKFVFSSLPYWSAYHSWPNQKYYLLSFVTKIWMFLKRVQKKETGFHWHLKIHSNMTK